MNRKRLTLVAQYSLINQQISGSIGGSDKNPCLGVFKTNVPKCFTLEEVDQFERFLTTLSNKEAGQSTGLCSGTGKQCSLAAAASLKRCCNSIAFVWGMDTL